MNELPNKQAEIEVLGRIIKSPELMYQVSDQLTHDDFADVKHKSIYVAMQQCVRSGKPIEIGILMDNLKDVSILDVLEISGTVASTSDIQYYIDIVKEAGKTRRFQKMMTKSVEETKTRALSDVMDRVMRELYELNLDTARDGAVDVEELMNQTLSYIEEGIRTEGKSIGMKTGWWDIDKALKGLNKGDIVLLGGRPSMGKTAWALNLVSMITGKHKVLMFELEMKAYKVGLRQISAKSGVPLDVLYEPYSMDQTQLTLMNKAVSMIYEKGNFILDDTPRVSLGYIRQKIQFIKKTQGVDVVIIDHIGLIKEEKGFTSRNDWLGEVTASFKAMAKEFDVNIIMVSQLSRGLEHRPDKRPVLSDLRDSGNLEQDADVVLFVYRDGYYNPELVLGPVEPLEIIIAKNRDGIVGVIEMAINLSIQRVTEVYRT